MLLPSTIFNNEHWEQNTSETLRSFLLTPRSKRNISDIPEVSLQWLIVSPAQLLCDRVRRFQFGCEVMSGDDGRQ